MSGINVEPQSLRDKYDEIALLDEKLDAASGSKASGKRAIKNRLVNDASAQATDVVSQTVSYIENIEEDEVQAGVFFALVSALEDRFSKPCNVLVSDLVEADDSPQVTLSPEELAAISEERKEKVKEFQVLKSILEMFGQDEAIAAIPEPKSRRGGRGPRGPRTLSKFQYKVNETELESEVNSLSTVAKLCGNIKVAELKSHIADQGIDLKNPPTEWQAELPNDVGTLYANVLEQYEADFEDEDESEDDE